MSEAINLKECLIQTCDELFPKYKLDHSYAGEMSDKTLNSGDPVNLLVGLSKGVDGNIVFGMSKEAAFQIVTTLLNIEEIFTLDNSTRNALSKFVSSICKKTAYKLETEKPIDISSPTLITGERICLMISNTPAQKVFFNINGNRFNIAYSIEG